MATNDAPADEPAALDAGSSAAENSSSSTVTIHILCPSVPASGRVTLLDMPLETTVAQLQERIAQSFPGNPSPRSQRLIYRGRPLAMLSRRLSDVVDPVQSSEHTIHLVLPPPDAPVHSSHDASVSDVMTDADEQAADAPPSYSSATAGLRYRGSREVVDQLPNTAVHVNVPHSAFTEYLDVLQRLASMENHLNDGLLPSNEALYQLRVQIDQLLRNPLEFQRSPLAIPLEELQLRITTLYRRVDTIQNNRGRSVHLTQQPFLAIGPDGQQCLLIPADGVSVSTLAESMLQTGNTAPGSAGSNTAPQRVHRPADPDRQDVLHQAVLNLQRRQLERNAIFGHFLLRVWLFIRLYFCIFMLTPRGSWVHYFLAIAAVLFVVLINTHTLNRLQEAVAAPVLRRVEDLARTDGRPGQAGQAAGVQAGRGAPTLFGELWDYLRGMGRAVLLLLASLIPGIGERQVQARNAAEAETQRRRQEGQQQQEEEPVAQPEADAPQPDAAAENGARD